MSRLLILEIVHAGRLFAPNLYSTLKHMLIACYDVKLGPYTDAQLCTAT